MLFFVPYATDWTPSQRRINITLALLLYTILEMFCRGAGEHITTRQMLERFVAYAATYMQFDDGSWLKMASALNDVQQQMIELLKLPPPAVYLNPEVTG